MWFSRNQLQSSTTNSSETNLKQKASLKQKQNCPKIMPPIVTNKKIDSNTEIQNTSVDFNKLNYLEESTNTCSTVDESEKENTFL